MTEDTASAAGLEKGVRDALDEVLDPCSTFTERPQSVVELGLIDWVSIENGDVTVELLPTNQLCPYIPHMIEDIETRVGGLRDVDAVNLRVVADEVWTPDRMTGAARRDREEHFQQRVTTEGLEPAYDGEEWATDVPLGAGEE